MLCAKVRKDLREKVELPPTHDGWLPIELINETFEVEQPESIEDDEFNMIISWVDRSGETVKFLVNSIDFDFHNRISLRELKLL